MIEKKEEQIQRKFNEVEELQAETERVKKLQLAQLEKIATMTASQAKELLLKEIYAIIGKSITRRSKS